MELEIRVMWCKGITTSFNFFQKLAVYTAVSITPEDQTLKITQDQKQEQKTPIDQEGDGNPEWNSIMKFDLSPPNISSNLNKLALVFELRNQGQLFGYKEIGEVRVPVRDLVESVGVGVGRLVSYEVRGPDGKHNGVLDFSYKVINKADLGNYVADSKIQMSGFENHHCCPRKGHDYYSEPEKIQYPKIDYDMGPNPNSNPGPIMPSIWAHENQHPQFWAPPLPLPAHYEEPPPPPPPRILPPPPPPEQQPYAYRPPPEQQPYAYRTPPYGDPYWAGYQGPPPGYHQQQPSGGGYEYPHW